MNLIAIVFFIQLAEYEGHGELGFAYLQDGGGGGKDAGENGQRGDEE